MQKFLALITIALSSITAVIAQTPEASTTTATAVTTEQSATAVTPAVNAVELNQPATKCSTGHSCCSSASKTAAVTTASTEAPAAEATTEQKCQSVSFGMSAAKPEATTVSDEKPKE